VLHFENRKQTRRCFYRRQANTVRPPGQRSPAPPREPEANTSVFLPTPGQTPSGHQASALLLHLESRKQTRRCYYRREAKHRPTTRASALREQDLGQQLLVAARRAPRWSGHRARLQAPGPACRGLAGRDAGSSDPGAFSIITAKATRPVVVWRTPETSFRPGARAGLVRVAHKSVPH
jgi:hypothetical protein